MMDKRSFVLYKDLCEIFRKLSDEEAGKLIKTICFTDYKPDKITGLLFHPFEMALQRDQEKYDRICIRNSENIKKRYTTKSTSGRSRIPKPTKSTDKDNDNDSDSDNDNDNTNIYTNTFNNAWSFYPKRSGTNSKTAAFRQWEKRLHEKHTENEMLNGIKSYQIFCNETGKTNTEYVMAAARFLGKDKYFNNDWSVTDEQNSSNKTARQHNADVTKWIIDAFER